MMSSEKLIEKSLNNWNKAIFSRKLEKARQLKKEIDSKIDTMKKNQSIQIYFSLLNYRYQLLEKNVDGADRVIKEIEPPPPTDNYLTFYYHFFKAIHATSKENYREASQHFEKTNTLLKWVSDIFEKAEYDYKIAEFYYHIEQPLLALHYAPKALHVFNKDGFEVKQAGCQNMMGLSCVLLKQFVQAEEYFLSALDIVSKQNEEHLALLLRYNLGFLYSKQNHSQAAILHLTEAYNKKFQPHKTAFLLASEYYNLKQPIEAGEYIQEGLQHCVKIGNEEYKHHLTILYMLNTEATEREVESVLKEGISYFKKEILWGYVQEYTEKAALYFSQIGNHEKACHYFHLSYEAKQKYEWYQLGFKQAPRFITSYE